MIFRSRERASGLALRIEWTIPEGSLATPSMSRSTRPVPASEAERQDEHVAGGLARRGRPDRGGVVREATVVEE
jgi:hypothetical protein